MRLLFLFKLFALPALMALATFPALAAVPEAAIPQLQKAIDDSNVPLLEKHMDLDSVVNKAADFLLADPAALKAAQKTPAVALLIAGMGSDPQAKAMLKSILVQETRGFVVQGVSSGAFAGKKISSGSKNKGLLSPLFAGASKGRKEFGTTTLLERKDGSARISTSLYDAGAKERYPLELRLEEQHEVWRITEVLNIRQLIAMASGD